MAEVGDRGRLQRSSIAYSQATDCIRQLVAQLGGEVTMNSIFFYFDFHTNWKGFIQGDFFNWPPPDNVSRLAPPKFA